MTTEKLEFRSNNLLTKKSVPVEKLKENSGSFYHSVGINLLNARNCFWLDYL